MDNARALLSRTFGFSEFRPGQEDAIAELIGGRDVTVLLPTGGGKSICYQLPALLARQAGKGPTLVVSPLISLMDDQVKALLERGVEAYAVHSGKDIVANGEAISRFRQGRCDIIYVSPERAVQRTFGRFAKEAGVSFLAIDEAHCVSQWGHDFRQEYMQLKGLRETLDIPTMALTATATPTVMDEVKRHLALRTPYAVQGSFERPNLSFSVHHISRDKGRLERLIATLEEKGIGQKRDYGGRAIVYCASRKKVKKVADALRAAGFASGYYHAGRTEGMRRRVQEAYEKKKLSVLVATNAFGMGIDHPDVRLIVHFQTPGSVEAYYQEAGRAGRDGLPAKCELYFGIPDLITQRLLATPKRGKFDADLVDRRAALLEAIEGYARSEKCRQQTLSNYFAPDRQEITPCKSCDYCMAPDTLADHLAAARAPKATAKKERPLINLPHDDLEIILAAAAALKRPVGKLKLARALRGSKAKAIKALRKLPQYDSLSHFPENSVVAAVESLLSAGKLEHRGKKYPTVWLAGRPVRPRKSGDGPRSTAKKSRSNLVRALENYRRRTARHLKWKPYMVFHRKVILAIDELEPRDLWSLKQIDGLGPAKISRFGQDLLHIIEEHAS
jgi:ATP-dependent DNA helicase RecQ